MRKKRRTRQTVQKQLKELTVKIDNVMSHLLYLEKQLPIRPKKHLSFEECIPPSHVCKEVFSMMNGITTYEGFLGKLAEYYGCEVMHMYVDTTINPKYVAEYRPLMMTAYSREETVEKRTVLHEFFHHLVNLNVVIIDKNKGEHYAEEYARIFLERANSP